MLHRLVELISLIATYLIDQLGITGIFLGMVLESACIPLPSEVIMLTGGFFVAKGMFTFGEIVAAGVLGNLVGSILIYWVGAKGARTLLEKYGKYVFLNLKHLEKSEAWFTKYGEWATFIGRNLPFIRTFISLPAGIARMNFGRFCLFTFLGCLPWNIALTYMGYSLGANWTKVEAYVRPVSYGILLIIILLALRFLYTAFREKRASKGDGK
jgi:membrane protein DedA with SNARE-associated domain